MFYSGPDDEDDEDFTPTSTTSSKLSALFGGKADNKSSNLKYVAPKQPRPDRTDSSGSIGTKSTAQSPSKQQTTTPASHTTAVLSAAPVHVYLYLNGVAQSQGRVMCCIIGNCAEKNFHLLIYRSKQDHLTRTKIHQQFAFTVLPNNYMNFTDEQQRNWSVMFEAGQYVQFITQMGLCCALVGSVAGSNSVFTQDIIIGEGPSLKEGDQAQVSMSTWNVTNGKKGDQIDEMKTGHRIKLKEVTGTWMTGLLGAQKNTRRVIFMHLTQDSSAPKIYDVTVERVKQKGSDLSGRSTPQVENQQGLREGSTDESGTSEIIPKDLGGNVKEDSGSNTKASLVSRMARVGHPLLPPKPINSHTLPTDSESEVEEIARAKTLRHNSGSVSGSMEELAATPAVRSRASSARSDTQRPEPAARPPHLTSQPQHLVVYQPTWQQPGMVPAGYSTAPSGPSGPHGIMPQQISPASDPTLPLLFSETRSQNTELKIMMSKMSDKVDSLMNKVENMEKQQQQDGGTLGQSGVIPLRMMHSHQEQYFHNSAVNADPHGLLTQITSIVSENDKMKAKLDEKEKKIASLNDSVTQLLQKNQRLLEEKTEMLVARQNQTQEANASVSISEVLSLREEKATIAAELSVAQHQLSVLKNELCQSKKSLETQKKEIHGLKTKLQPVQSAKQQANTLAQEHISSKKEILEENLQTLQTEKDHFKSLLNTAKESKQKLQQDLAVMTSKKESLEEQLQITHTECEKLKVQDEATETKHKTLMQQMEEERKLNKNGSGEKQLESQQVKKLQIQSSKINQLEDEISRLHSRCSEVMEERDRNENKHELQVQNLAAEKSVLEEALQKLKKATPSHGSISPEELIGTVKKVMNTVFRSLKSQFLDEETYLGSDVLQILQSVIRDTTLQVLEELERKIAEAESSRNNETVTSIVKEKAREGNEDKSNGILSQVKVNEVSMDNELKKRANTREGQSLVENKEESSQWKDPGEEKVFKIEVSKQTVRGDSYHDKESRAEVICQSHKILLSYCDCSNTNDYNESDSPSYLGRKQKDEAQRVIQVKGNKEAVKSVDKEPRVPVVDMENTEVRNMTSEKSDSSRDSSMERVLSPQPRQPLLFSDDDDDDDDWLQLI